MKSRIDDLEMILPQIANGARTLTETLLNTFDCPGLAAIMC